ncbi:MAG: N-acetyltransferase [Terracidiphilus sp.]
MLYHLYYPEEFEALYAIEEVCFQPPFRFSRRYMRSLVDARHTATWIAEDDCRMAGFAIVDWRNDSGELIAYIQTIEVTPEYRGRGVGGELLRRVEGSACAAGAIGIWLHADERNNRAVRLYSANGYSCEGLEPDYYAPGRAALIYWKLLVPKPGC